MPVDVEIIKKVAAAHETYSAVPFREQRPSHRVVVGLGFKLAWPGAPDILKTIGVNPKALLSKNPASLTPAQVQRLLDITVAAAIAEAEAVFPNFGIFPLNVQVAVADIIFDIGADFRKALTPFIRAIHRENYGVAADALRASSYYKGAGIRGKDAVALLMETHNIQQRARAAA